MIMADQEFFVTGKGYTAEDKLLGFLERNAKELILKDSSWGIYGKKNGYVLRSDQGVLEEGHNVFLCEMCNMGSLKNTLVPMDPPVKLPVCWLRHIGCIKP